MNNSVFEFKRNVAETLYSLYLGFNYVQIEFICIYNTYNKFLLLLVQCKNPDCELKY